MEELPNALPFDKWICLLQKYRQQKDLKEVQYLQALIVEQELDGHPVLANYLVPALVECRSLPDARCVFDHIECNHRNHHSWNSLISGYICYGEIHHAFDLYHQMRYGPELVRPDKLTYLALLSACSALKDTQRGLLVHGDVILLGLEGYHFMGSVVLGNSLVDMYGKCGLLAEARQVFDSLNVRNRISWNALIAGYSEHGQSEQVGNCFKQMLMAGVSPNSVTFMSSLKACSSFEVLKTGQEMHIEIVCRGFDRELHIASSVVDMYRKCGSLPEAMLVFDVMSVRDTVTWAAMLIGYAEHGLSEEMGHFIQQMLDEGIPHDAVTLACSLRACSNAYFSEVGNTIFSVILRIGLESDQRVGSCLVDMYTQFGMLADAYHIFERLPVRNVVSWNAIIAGFNNFGLSEKVGCFADQMLMEGISPDSGTCACCLKASGNMAALEAGQIIHSKIIKNGFERDRLANLVVDMYSKCGSLGEARHVLDNLAACDGVSWASLISGYSDQGDFDEAKACLQQMQTECVDSVMLACSLKLCSVMQALKSGQELHMEVTKKGLETDSYMGGLVVDMYARCCSLVEARQVFDELTVHDVFSWNALVSGYAEQRLIKKLNICFQEMLLHGIAPDFLTYQSGLKVRGSLETLETCQILHTELVKRGFDREMCMSIPLIDLYAKCSLLGDARYVLCLLPERNAVVWNMLTAGCLENGLNEEALSCYNEMLQEGVSPDLITTVCIVRCCGACRAFERGQAMHSEAIKRGFEIWIDVGNALVDMYGISGMVAEAHKVLEDLPLQDTDSWAALIAGYIDHGFSMKAMNCLGQMQEKGIVHDLNTLILGLKACGMIQAVEMGHQAHIEASKKGLENDRYIASILVDMYTECSFLEEARCVLERLPARDTIMWNVLLAGYGDVGLLEEAESCLHQMLLDDIAPDCVTYVFFLKACASRQVLEKGQETHAEAVKRGFDEDMYMGSILVDLYSECSMICEACQVSKMLPSQNTVTFNALIAAYAECGLCDVAINCLNQIPEGVSPDPVTFSCCLKACATIQALETGRELHSEAVKRGFEKDSYMGTSLMHMYIECSLLVDAQHILQNLPVKNETQWNAMIAGYSDYGLTEDVESCFKEMLLEGIAPDSITFISILKEHIGIEKGLETHNEVVKLGFENGLHMGSVLVDMYVKSERLPEAYCIFNRLTGRNLVTWNAMIAGYAEFGLVEEVEGCYQKILMEGIPPDALTLVYSLKACTLIGSLEMGQQTHTRIVGRGLEKEISVSTAMVDMYSKCGSLQAAYKVFCGIPVRTTALWNALLGGYSEQELEEKAGYLKQMLQDNISLDAITIAHGLRTCIMAGDLEAGQALHSIAIKYGFENELPLGNILVDMYGKCGSPKEARQMLDRLPICDTGSCSGLIAGYMAHGVNKEVGNFFNQLYLEGFLTDSFTIFGSLKACYGVDALATAQELHAEATKRGWDIDDYVGCSLVDMYGKCGSHTEARKVFDKLSHWDSVTWASLMVAYMECGVCEEAGNCFQKMLLDSVTPDCVSYACALKAYGNVGALEMGQQLHCAATKRGLEKELYVGSTLVDMYGNCGLLADAQHIFDELPARSVVTWTEMIKAYGKNHEGSMAVKCFHEMQEHGVKPTSITYICLLAACSHSSLVHEGQEFFNLMCEQHKIIPTLDHYICMVDIFARAGHLYEAERLVATMQCSPSRTILYSLLSLCKIHGELETAHRCFQQLVEVNQEDASAYLLMADIYASAGMSGDAMRLEETRKFSGAQKKPGSAFIELDRKLIELVVGANKSESVLATLERLNSCMKDKGLVPNLSLVSISM